MVNTQPGNGQSANRQPVNRQPVQSASSASFPCHMRLSWLSQRPCAEDQTSGCPMANPFCEATTQVPSLLPTIEKDGGHSKSSNSTAATSTMQSMPLLHLGDCSSSSAYVCKLCAAQEPLAKISSGAITCARNHHAHRQLVNMQPCNR